MKLKYFQYFILILINFIEFIGSSANDKECFNPDGVYGSCVPMANCRRIEWMLQNWQAPYPEHIQNYIRQSHCGSQGDIHFACCAFYDIKGHSHNGQQNTVPANFQHNPQHPLHKQHNNNNNSSLHHHHRPTANYYNQPLGEQILRSMPCGPINGDRISNGENVKISEFPWMVLLESSGAKTRERFRCAGTLITNQYVLTAAHCAEPGVELISVRLGEHDLSSEHDCEKSNKKSNHHSESVPYCAPPYEDVGVSNIDLHPEYKKNPIQNDIALIRLVRPVKFQSHIKPICLPMPTQIMAQIPSDQIVAGWGVTEKGYASNVLLKATLPVHSTQVCQDIYQRNLLLTPGHLCAGGTDQISTCRADSGGPLFTAVPYEHHQTRYVQFGITSAGSYSCGNTQYNRPGIYTNIQTYMPWIISKIY